MNGSEENSEEMSVKPRKRKRREHFVLSYQARILISRLHSYLKKESTWGGPIKELSCVKERVADAFEISGKTVSKIIQEGENELLEKATKRRKVYVTRKVRIDPFDECSVRNHIYGYYERKEWPTRKKLLYTLKIANLFNGDKPSLNTLLDKIKFKWRKINRKKCLLEKDEVIAARCLYIHNIQLYDIKKVIFLGETYIDAGNRSAKSGVIVIHAGSAEGFVPNCCLLIRSLGIRDFRQEIKADVYKEWFIQSFLKNIPDNSVIVMDNTSTHLVLKEKTPNSLSKKQEIQDWLTKNNIEWSPSMLKGVLLDLVNTHKPLKKRYEFDELAEDEGHSVIRLPVKHSEYNPIELIWTELKAKIAQKKKPHKISEFEKLTREVINSITVEDWNRAIELTADVIENARIREELVERNIEEMIVMGGEDWSSSSSQSVSEYDETEEDEDEQDDEEGEQEIPASLRSATLAITLG